MFVIVNRKPLELINAMKIIVWQTFTSSFDGVDKIMSRETSKLLLQIRPPSTCLPSLLHNNPIKDLKDHFDLVLHRAI